VRWNWPVALDCPYRFLQQLARVVVVVTTIELESVRNV
jgi:hypothetical protein